MIQPPHFFSKYQNKAEFNNLEDSEVLSRDYLGLRTSAASLASSALATSLDSITSAALYHAKELPDPNDWSIPGTKMTSMGPFLWNGSSKIQFFTDFLWEAVV